MEEDETLRLLNKIGQELADDREYAPDGTLLYAKLDYDMVVPSIFLNRGNYVAYRELSTDDLGRFGDLLFDLWDAQEPDKRWAEIEYVVRDGEFEVTFNYREDIDPEEDSFHRRKRIVARYFGEKPIVYPPIANDAHSFDL